MLKFSLVVLCIQMAVVSTVNLIFLPLLFLLTKDPKGKMDYGIIVPVKSTLSSDDFSNFYAQTILRLEHENETLKKDNNKLTTTNNRLILNNNKLTAENRYHKEEIEIHKYKKTKKEATTNTAVNRFVPRRESEDLLIEGSVSLPVATVYNVN